MEKSVLRFVLAFRNLANSHKCIQNNATQDAHGVYICTRMRVMRVPINYITYKVGFSVAVWIQRQCESLEMRNSKIAVPLFFDFRAGTQSRVSAFLCSVLS